MSDQEKNEMEGAADAAAATEDAHDHHHGHHHGHDHEEEEKFEFVEEPVFEVDYKGDSAYEVKVSIAPANEKKQAEKLLDELQEDAEMPGFRKGRAPRRLLEKKFGKALRGDATEKLVSAAFKKLVEEKKLRPIQTPKIDGLEGILERPEFYAACDRLGLLVWQEFPLSSSGVENWPPEYPEVIETLKRIAAEYIYRRSHHASHLLWCGGNELQGEIDGRKTGGGKPVDENHPCMRGFAEVAGRLDPDKRLLPTSPTGPRFYAQKEDFGKGLHHHIHGPWANLPLSERYEYFNGDDAMFRSELGAPGNESLEAIERFRGNQKAWPPRPDNAYWLHPACAWIPWRDVTREFGPVEDRESELAFVVKASQYLQAESYRYAAESVRRRAMYSSGFMIWMGHDCDHCTANNSVIELTGWTKPAYAWLQRAFAPLHVSLRHDRYHYAPGEALSGQVWANRRAGDAAAAGVVHVRLLSFDGKEHATTELPIRFNGEESVLCGSIEWTVPECPHKLFVVDMVLELDGVTARNRYVLSQTAAHPMSPLRTLPGATLSVVETTPVDKRRRRTTVRNDGLVAAVGVELSARSLSWTLMADQNYLVILPGEQATFEYEVLPTCSMGGRSSRGAKLQLDWFNSDTSLPIKE